MLNLSSNAANVGGYMTIFIFILCALVIGICFAIITSINNSKRLNDLGVECPYCHSTNTRKITTGSKIGHTLLFGIFSISRNGKQWHCNNCGSNW